MLLRSCTLCLLALLAPLCASAQEASAPAPPAASDPAAPAQKDPVDEKFYALVMEAQVQHSQGSFFQAMSKLDEAEKLRPENPVVHNVRGSVYTAQRDFDKARECFEKARSLNPTSFEPRFNLIELDFVQMKYPQAEAAFTALLSDNPKLRMDVRHLTQFKIIVCRLKMRKLSEAEVMMKEFTFMDDTPAYYYCQAALAFEKNDKNEAQSWLTKAGKIYKPETNLPYIDTLMEARWIPNVTVPSESKAEDSGAPAPSL